MTDVFRAAELDSSDYTEKLLAPPMATPTSGDIVVLLAVLAALGSGAVVGDLVDG